MKIRIGYPCLNYSLDCRNNLSFRLASYNPKRFKKAVENNLTCLKKILEYNLKHALMFFRITSDLIPFGSHPICKIKWWQEYKKEFVGIGRFIKKNKMRVSLHPGQYTVLNSNREEVVEKSILELEYHTRILDAMELDKTHKIQIHVGGVYGEKEKSIARFVRNYQKLNKNIRERLAIENDDKSYSLSDCMQISKKVDIPVIFDWYHHQIINNEESLDWSLKATNQTWKKSDGVMILDYSSQKQGELSSRHTEHININDFKKFLIKLKKNKISADVMLEIKDKEKSALLAKKLVV